MLNVIYDLLDKLAFGNENGSKQLSDNRQYVKPKAVTISPADVAGENTRLLHSLAETCYRCNTKRSYPLADAKFRYKCRDCGHMFNSTEHNVVSVNGRYLIK